MNCDSAMCSGYPPNGRARVLWRKLVRVLRGVLPVGLIVLLLGAIGVLPARADVGGAAIVGYLNAQRAAQGVPAGIVHDPSLSAACANHNAYGAINHVLAHSEDPSQPGYTAAGNYAAGNSVLYQGSGPWSAGHNPFETAPIHLHQLLAPRLDRMGASENQGYGCATTLVSLNRPAPAAHVTYTYPGNGAKGWPAAQVAAEGPYTPGQLVGIPAGTRTGPYLYVMFDGPDLTPSDVARATGAALTGPKGPVSVAVVDNATPGLAGYLPTGMQVIPRTPLRPGASYTASVAARVTTQSGSGPARAFSRTWSFSTAPVLSFASSPKSLRVSKTGRFSYRLLAMPGRSGKVRITGRKRVRIGSSKRKMKLGSKSFTASANAKAKVKFKLSRKNLRVLKRHKSLRFAVRATLGGQKLHAKLTLKRPKRS